MPTIDPINLGWTLDSLHHHTQAQIGSLHVLLDERHAAQTIQTATQIRAVEQTMAASLGAAAAAVLKAEAATEKRFESVNEFRRTISDLASRNVTREEQAQVQARNDERIQSLTDRLNRTEGKSSGSQASLLLIFAIIAAVGTLVTIYAYLIGASR